jgi:hypothetical protein
MKHRLTIIALLTNLRQLRQRLEAGTGGLTEEQALLLNDVCQALGLGDSETYYVVGDSFPFFIDMPIRYEIKGNGLGPTAVIGEAPGSPNVGDVSLVRIEPTQPQKVSV